MSPISGYAWAEQQFLQVVSTFADVYFKDVSAPLESICYLGPHACYIKAKFPRAMFLWQVWFAIEKYAGVNQNIW